MTKPRNALLLLAVASLIAASLAAASPALAAKGGVPGKPGGGEPETPLPGYTCSQTEVDLPWFHQSWATWAEEHTYQIGDTTYEVPRGLKTDDFTFTLTPDEQTACFDVITSTAGRWKITVSGSGARWATIVPRDAVAPGDSCGGVSVRGRYLEYLYGTILLPDPGDTRFDAIPAATVNACLGNAEPDSPFGGQFSEYVDRYEDLNDNGVFDEGEPVTTMLEDEPIPGETHPLVFLFFSGGLKKASDTLTVTVDLPPTAP